MIYNATQCNNPGERGLPFCRVGGTVKIIPSPPSRNTHTRTLARRAARFLCHWNRGQRRTPRRQRTSEPPCPKAAIVVLASYGTAPSAPPRRPIRLTGGAAAADPALANRRIDRVDLLDDGGSADKASSLPLACARRPSYIHGRSYPTYPIRRVSELL